MRSGNTYLQPYRFMILVTDGAGFNGASDVAEYWADSTLARQLLGWQTRRDIDAICADVWRWQSGRTAAD